MPDQRDMIAQMLMARMAPQQQQQRLGAPGPVGGIPAGAPAPQGGAPQPMGATMAPPQFGQPPGGAPPMLGSPPGANSPTLGQPSLPFAAPQPTPDSSNPLEAMQMMIGQKAAYAKPDAGAEQLPNIGGAY